MDKGEIKEAFAEAMEEARKKFWVDPETHFIHHKELEGWIKTFGLVRKSVIVSFAVGLVAGFISIFWLGFKAYMKLKGHVE